MNQVLNVSLISFQSKEMLEYFESIQSVDLVDEYVEYFHKRELRVKTFSNETDYINIFCKSLDNINIKKPDFYLDENEVLEILVNFGQVTFLYIDDSNVDFSHNGKYYSRECRLLRLFCFSEQINLSQQMRVKHLFIVSKQPQMIKQYIEQQLIEQYRLIERLDLQKIHSITYLTYDDVKGEIKKLKPPKIERVQQLECVFRIFGMRNQYILAQVLKGILSIDQQFLFDRADQMEKRRVTNIWLSGIKQLKNEIVVPNQFAIILMDKDIPNYHLKGLVAYNFKLKLAEPNINQFEGLCQCPNNLKKLEFHTDFKKYYPDCIFGASNYLFQHQQVDKNAELDEFKNQIQQKVISYQPYSLYLLRMKFPTNFLSYSAYEQFPQLSKFLYSYQGLESLYYGKITKLKGPSGLYLPQEPKLNVLAVKQIEDQTLYKLIPGTPLNGKKFYLCRICKEQDVNCLLIPCSHYRYCLDCIGNQQECLFCDQPIQARIPLTLLGLNYKQYQLYKLNLTQIIDGLMHYENPIIDPQTCSEWIKLYNNSFIDLNNIQKCDCNQIAKAFGQCAQNHITYMCKLCFSNKKIKQCRQCLMELISRNEIIKDFHE